MLEGRVMYSVRSVDQNGGMKSSMVLACVNGASGTMDGAIPQVNGDTRG